jgi:hypothetical protein
MKRVSRGYEVGIKCPERKPVVYGNVKDSNDAKHGNAKY